MEKFLFEREGKVDIQTKIEFKLAKSNSVSFFPVDLSSRNFKNRSKSGHFWASCPGSLVMQCDLNTTLNQDFLVTS